MAERRLGRLGIAAMLVVMLSILAASLGCGNQPPAGNTPTASGPAAAGYPRAATLAPPPTATPIPTPTAEPTPIVVGSLPCERDYTRSGSIYHFFLHWTPDGSRLIFNRGSKIFSVSPDGDQLQYLVNANTDNHLWDELYADVSPDGSKIIYSSCTPSAKGARYVSYEISIMNADGTGRQDLTKPNYRNERLPVWSPGGDRIVYVTEYWPGNLNLIDYKRLSTNLRSQTVFQSSDPYNEWLAQYPPAWSPDGGRIVFITMEPIAGDLEKPRYFLNIIAADGSGRENISTTTSVAAWSPDGGRIALIRRDGDNTALFTIAPDGSSPRMIARIGDWDGYPGEFDWAYMAELFDIVAWSPDGGRILYSCQGLCIAEVDGGGVVELSGFNAFAPNTIRAAWSPDGSMIAVQGNAIHSRETAMIHIIEPDGAGVRVIDIFDWIRQH